MYLKTNNDYISCHFSHNFTENSVHAIYLAILLGISLIKMYQGETCTTTQIVLVMPQAKN